jgi:hypothetical protein
MACLFPALEGSGSIVNENPSCFLSSEPLLQTLNLKPCTLNLTHPAPSPSSPRYPATTEVIAKIFMCPCIDNNVPPYAKYCLAKGCFMIGVRGGDERCPVVAWRGGWRGCRP